MYTVWHCDLCPFHLEKLGFSWKLLSHDVFKDIRFSRDNLMKMQTAQGLGNNVQKVQVLSSFDEDLLLSLGLLGKHNPQVLLGL